MGVKNESEGYEWKDYYQDVYRDFAELKEQYPFSSLIVPPTQQPELATVNLVAANNELISALGAIENDFLGTYSRKLFIVVPKNYKKKGCFVYGGKWIDYAVFPPEDWHFYPSNENDERKKGYQFCVGTPESFSMLKNVLLENVRTAEMMLIAYERVMAGDSKKLELIAYKHDKLGEKQYREDKTKYTTL